MFQPTGNDARHFRMATEHFDELKARIEAEAALGAVTPAAILELVTVVDAVVHYIRRADSHLLPELKAAQR